MNKISPKSTLLSQFTHRFNPKRILTSAYQYFIKHPPVSHQETPNKQIQITLLPEKKLEDLCDANFKRKMEELHKKFETSPSTNSKV